MTSITTVRLMPPSAGQTVINIHGRQVVCPANSTVDVPYFDAKPLEANGWIPVAAGGVGTTAQRPTDWTMNDKGRQFHDTTIGNNIIWDGKTWRNSDTGALV